MTTIHHAYHVGEHVTLKKYGGYYPAKVVKVGPKTVTVEFTTVGGKAKTYTVPGHEVAYALTPFGGAA